MIKRHLLSKIASKLNQKKTIILLGARQTGKTTLLKSLVENMRNVLWLNGDEPDTNAIFENSSSTKLKATFAGYKIIIIDEAQRIRDIGLKLKLITDQIPALQVIATGSSSFELTNNLNEPLTGRKWEYKLYPLSFQEMTEHHGLINENRLLSHRLIYGYYPEIVTAAGSEKEVLHQLTDSYLYKDILIWQNIKKADKLINLLKALALQVSNEVSFNELGKITGLDNQTVEKYIHLLEQCFVIFRLNAFSRNLRKELKKSRKIYFYDNGIRNALIANFALPEMRTDIGALWENYLISERLKYCHYNSIWANKYFWRTRDQQEIDYVEDRDGVLHAFEFKWNTARKAHLPKGFASTYPNHKFKVITPDNYQEFVSNT